MNPLQKSCSDFENELFTALQRSNPENGLGGESGPRAYKKAREALDTFIDEFNNTDDLDLKNTISERVVHDLTGLVKNSQKLPDKVQKDLFNEIETLCQTLKENAGFHPHFLDKISREFLKLSALYDSASDIGKTDKRDKEHDKSVELKMRAETIKRI